MESSSETYSIVEHNGEEGSVVAPCHPVTRRWNAEDEATISDDDGDEVFGMLCKHVSCELGSNSSTKSPPER